MSYKNILVSKEGKIGTVVINRPKSLNALNQETILEIGEAMEALAADSEILGIILTGSGEKAFAAGADIKGFSDYSFKEAHLLSEEGHAVFRKIECLAKPVLAAVNGFALGGGLELAMSCHIRIGSENAKFGLPETSLGLIPGYGGTQRLIQLVGKGKALEMVLTGDMISAADAKACGLITHVASQEELLGLANKILSKSSRKGPLALAKAIEVMNVYFNDSQKGMEAEKIAFGQLFDTEDAKEGIAAFMEKRKANFKGQ